MGEDALESSSTQLVETYNDLPVFGETKIHLKFISEIICFLKILPE